MYVRAKWTLTMVLAAATLGIAGCKAEVGPAGANGGIGAQGQSGEDGAPGAQGGTGPVGQAGPQGVAGPTAPFATVSGYVKFMLDTTKYPASGVTVKACLPGTGCLATTTVATATTGSDGSYSFSSTKNPLPYGTYDFQYTSSDYASATTPNVYVPAAGLTLTTLFLIRTNPLYVQLGTPDVIPFGTSGQVKTLKVIAGTPATYAWSIVSGPSPTSTAFTADADQAIPTLAMDSFANIKSALGLILPARPGLLAVSPDLQSKMSYKIQCVVRDAAGNTNTVTATVASAFATNGNERTVPLGVMQILTDDPSKGASWTLAGPSAAALSNAADVNAWFIPDAVGTYVAQNSATGASVAIQADTFSGIGNCKTCHDGKTNGLSDKYSDVMAGKHMNHDGASGVLDQSHTLFASGVDGLQGEHYSAGCLPCHTTGYVLGAANGGFDDFATALGWLFPDNSTVNTSRFSDVSIVPAQLQALAGMQCETCHGPANDHAVTESKAPPPSYAAETCAYCHDKPKSHDKVYLWKMSKHAVRTTIGTETSCSKCHSANNFIQWAKGGFEVDFTALPPTESEIEPTTCQACHDPHLTALRASGDVALLNGYTVSGAGAGVLCMVCHNSRSGLHDDYSATPAGKGPHEGTQADVMFGVNAYFVTGYEVSQHAAVDDECVGCHMKLHPASVTAAKTNHTFTADDTICATCHGTAVTGEGTAGAFDFAVGDLEARMLSVMKPRLPATYYVVAQDPAGVTDRTKRLTPQAVTLTQSPTAIDVALYADCATLVMTFATAVPDPFGSGTTTTLWVKATDIDRAGPIAVTSDGIHDPQYTIAQPVIGGDGTFAKALWNLLLLTRDRSHGIHNPSFAFDVLGATKARALADTADPL